MQKLAELTEPALHTFTFGRDCQITSGVSDSYSLIGRPLRWNWVARGPQATAPFHVRRSQVEVA
jgi:hypothetical protein